MTADMHTVYPCEVREVFSGDDLIVLIDLGVEGLFKRQRIRLSGVDTPNAVKAREDTTAGAIRREVRMLTRGKKGQISIVSRNASSWVVHLKVETPTGVVDVNQWLIDQGYEYKVKQG